MLIVPQIAKAIRSTSIRYRSDAKVSRYLIDIDSRAFAIWRGDLRITSWYSIWNITPDSKVHGANMGPIWGRQDPVGPHELCYVGL